MNPIGSIVMLWLVVGAAGCFAQPEPPQPPRPPRFTRVDLFGGPSSFLGVGVVEVDAERAKELKLKEERGVEVKSVEDGSPAAKAGVKVGDVVLDYNGQHVEGQEQFVRFVRETPVGRNVKLLISRNGAIQTLTAAIGSRASGQFYSKDFDDAMAKLRRLEMPDIPHAMMSMQSRALGVESESLSPQLAEYFGVKEGALVRSVARGSAAEKAGLKAGDVITKIGDRRVSSPSEISGVLRSSSSLTLPVTVVRNQKEIIITVTLEGKPAGGMGRPIRMDAKPL
jgi:serine protease Do